MKTMLAVLLASLPAAATTLEFRIANPTFTDPSTCFDASFASNPAAEFVINFDVVSMDGELLGTGQGCALAGTPAPELYVFADGSVTVLATVEQFGGPRSPNFIEFQSGVVTGGTGAYAGAQGTFSGHGPVFITSAGFDPQQAFVLQLSN